MKKNKLYLINNPYKKPISKKNLLYYSLTNKSNSNGEILNINSNFEEPILNNHLIDTIKTETSKRKYNYLYSNFKLFKKLKQNSPYSNIGKISSHDILKKKRLKNVNEMQDNNSFFFQYKEDEGKLFTNYNNTCNICLNQHFYNIDYNNYNSSNSLIKNNDIKSIIEKLKNKQKNKFSSNSKKSNQSNRNRKYKIQLNFLNKNFPINQVKDINNSYDFLYNDLNIVFRSNIIPTIKKRKNIKTLFPKNNLLTIQNEKSMNLNKASNLTTHTNYNKKKAKTKKIDKTNLNFCINKEKNDALNKRSNYDYKCKKKILSYNSLNQKNKNNYSYLVTNNNKPISNYIEKNIFFDAILGKKIALKKY